MGIEKTIIELKRPVWWKGSFVDMEVYAYELDYYECFVEGNAVIEIETDYGSDMDGNRGIEADFSYVEDIEIILEGDFRPLGRILKDTVRCWWLQASWKSFSDNKEYTQVLLDDTALSEQELAWLTEDLLEKSREREDEDGD